MPSIPDKADAFKSAVESEIASIGSFLAFEKMEFVPVEVRADYAVDPQGVPYAGLHFGLRDLTTERGDVASSGYSLSHLPDLPRMGAAVRLDIECLVDDIKQQRMDRAQAAAAVVAEEETHS